MKLHQALTLFFLLGILSGNVPLYSQTRLEWGKQFGSDKDEYAMNHTTDPEGNIYVAGKTAGSLEGINQGANDGFLMKFDKQGNVLWTRQFGCAGDEDILWSAADNKNNIYITGSTTGLLGKKSFGKEDIILVKYNAEGQLLWTKQFGTDSTDTGNGIYADENGDIYLTGMTMGKLGDSMYGKADGFILKLNPDGKILFTRQFGTTEDDFSNTVSGVNNRIFVGGSTWGELGGKNKGFMDAFAGEFSADGNSEKFYQFGTDGFEIVMDIKVDKKGDIYIGGSTSGSMETQQAGEGDCFLAKLRNDGTTDWFRQFGTENHDGIRSIALDETHGNILVSGLQHLPPAWAFIRNYKPDGTMLWEQKFKPEGENGDASGKDVSIATDGTIYHLGLTGSNFFSTSNGGHDVYLVKLKVE